MPSAPHPRRARSRQSRRGLAWLVALPLLLGGCQADTVPELKGRFGPGQGGPQLSAAIATHELQSPGGTVIGSFQYDEGLFLHYHPDPTDDQLHVIATVPEDQLLADVADDGEIDGLTGEEIVILNTPIVGRPDTPCRFLAAEQARDVGYTILAAGDRRNDQRVEFHQVNLRRGLLHQRFYCAQLQGNLGMEINVFTASDAVQDYLQLHAILNSVSPP